MAHSNAISGLNISILLLDQFSRLGVTIPGIFFNPGIQDISNPGIPGFFGIVSCEQNFRECQFGSLEKEYII